MARMTTATPIKGSLASLESEPEPEEDLDFVFTPPVSSPMHKPAKISCASSECPMSSNGSVESPPAQSSMTSSPPGCSSRYWVTS